jgi:glutathione peroxidase
MKSLVLALTCALSTALFAGVFVSAEEKKGDVPPLLKHEMKTLTGKKVDLSKYKGKVLLVVNVASQCGATPQYKPLEVLHEKYNEKGLAVLGFPCNQFGKQEPGNDEEVADFCQKNYGVKFDMFSKVDVNGEQAADLFKQLTSKEAFAKDAGPVKWNFEKFLISKKGEVVARFRTGVQPDSEEVVKAIEAELAK